MALQDKTLTCKDCGQSFVFTVGEQEFFQQRGLLNEPGRCPTCRQSRRSNGGSSSGRGERQMHTVVCAQCGKPAQVPFQPRGDRPVYCSDCFSRQSGGSRRY
ncbi:MAG: zinc-ribbon domain containing protein [Chloroflexi bacterium]|nr:zinc-ribbon domain containing protein [Chloroflexota bacterium]